MLNGIWINQGKLEMGGWVTIEDDGVITIERYKLGILNTLEKVFTKFKEYGLEVEEPRWYIQPAEVYEGEILKQPTLGYRIFIGRNTE